MYIFCTIFSGAFILGLIGDKFGRKLALILAVLLAGGSGCLQAFVGNRTLFALLRITVGMGGMGMFMIPAIFAGTYFTAWKFHDFTIPQILREINFGDSRNAKSAILT